MSTHCWVGVRVRVSQQELTSIVELSSHHQVVKGLPVVLVALRNGRGQKLVETRLLWPCHEHGKERGKVGRERVRKGWERLTSISLHPLEELLYETTSREDLNEQDLTEMPDQLQHGVITDQISLQFTTSLKTYTHAHNMEPVVEEEATYWCRSQCPQHTRGVWSDAVCCTVAALQLISHLLLSVPASLLPAGS